jgi:hypothetical protein
MVAGSSPVSRSLHPLSGTNREQLLEVGRPSATGRIPAIPRSRTWTSERMLATRRGPVRVVGVCPGGQEIRQPRRELPNSRHLALERHSLAIETALATTPAPGLGFPLATSTGSRSLLSSMLHPEDPLDDRSWSSQQCAGSCARGRQLGHQKIGPHFGAITPFGSCKTHSSDAIPSPTCQSRGLRAESLCVRRSRSPLFATGDQYVAQRLGVSSPNVPTAITRARA